MVNFTLFGFISLKVQDITIIDPFYGSRLCRSINDSPIRASTAAISIQVINGLAMANERLTWEEAVQWLRDRPDKQDLASLPKVKRPRSQLLIPSN